MPPGGGAWTAEALLLAALQVTGEASGRRGDPGAERRRAPSDHAHSGPACAGLHLLWPPSPLYHRHHEWSGFLHQLRHPLQPGRGHRVHGQQQHDPPWGPRGGAGSCSSEPCSRPVMSHAASSHSFPATLCPSCLPTDLPLLRVPAFLSPALIQRKLPPFPCQIRKCHTSMILITSVHFGPSSQFSYSCVPRLCSRVTFISFHSYLKLLSKFTSAFAHLISSGPHLKPCLNSDLCCFNLGIIEAMTMTGKRGGKILVWSVAYLKPHPLLQYKAHP